jgi:hypothetical protein
MPRTNDNRELLKQLDLVERFVQTTGGDQTATAAIVAGLTLATIAASTSFASADPVLIVGDGGTELNEITGTPATAMPLKYKIQLAQSIGARVLEMQKLTLGDIDPGGVKIASSQQLNAIMSAISNTPIAQYASPVELSFEIPLIGMNNLNLAAFFGITEAETGAGTTADPYALTAGQDNINTQGYLAYRVSGTLFDGRRIYFDIVDARQSANGTLQINRQAPTIITLSGKFNVLTTRINS